MAPVVMLSYFFGFSAIVSIWRCHVEKNYNNHRIVCVVRSQFYPFPIIIPGPANADRKHILPPPTLYLSSLLHLPSSFVQLSNLSNTAFSFIGFVVCVFFFLFFVSATNFSYRVHSPNSTIFSIFFLTRPGLVLFLLYITTKIYINKVVYVCASSAYSRIFNFVTAFVAGHSLFATVAVTVVLVFIWAFFLVLVTHLFHLFAQLSFTCPTFFPVPPINVFSLSSFSTFNRNWRRAFNCNGILFSHMEMQVHAEEHFMTTTQIFTLFKNW